ncbi:hypothetical protein HGRIS_004107 [Hohenbuehelia grisea]|uniref:Secreted protein n=1 Tax=Hohenbuehelia grisea TaxID=104357 RepID=A0ABR3JHG8_9AGAR
MFDGGSSCVAVIASLAALSGPFLLTTTTRTRNAAPLTQPRPPHAPTGRGNRDSEAEARHGPCLGKPPPIVTRPRAARGTVKAGTCAIVQSRMFRVRYLPPTASATAPLTIVLPARTARDRSSVFDIGKARCRPEAGR